MFSETMPFPEENLKGVLFCETQGVTVALDVLEDTGIDLTGPPNVNALLLFDLDSAPKTNSADLVGNSVTVASLSVCFETKEFDENVFVDEAPPKTNGNVLLTSKELFEQFLSDAGTAVDATKFVGVLFGTVDVKTEVKGLSPEEEEDGAVVFTLIEEEPKENEFVAGTVSVFSTTGKFKEDFNVAEFAFICELVGTPKENVVVVCGVVETDINSEFVLVWNWKELDNALGFSSDLTFDPKLIVLSFVTAGFN